MARFPRRVATSVALVALVLSTLVLVAPGASADSASAVAWLEAQQEPDGGFEVADFPGFETADAVAAIAAAAQDDGSWSTVEALDAVLAVQTDAHETPLSALDDYADGSIGAGQAAKLIVLVTNSLGLDPNLFDPECDGGSGVDLQSILGSPGSSGTYGISIAAFNQILFALRATEALGGSADPATVKVIRDAQRPDGSYAFNGNPVDDEDPFAFDDSDVDTTAAVVLALRAAGIAPGDDETLDGALAWLLAEPQRTDATGAWQAFGVDDPNATAVAMLALHAVNPATYATELSEGAAFLLSQQADDGHIASTNDGFGVNTFATSQAIQALELATIPDGGTGGLAACIDGNLDGVPDSEQPAVQTVPSFDGVGYVTVAASGDVALADVTTIAPDSVPAPPAGVTLPDGLVGFRVTDLAEGATVTVTITFHTGTDASSYFKLRGDGTWLDFSDHAVFSGNTVTLTLEDGGDGDDDGVANSVIVDPGGPATVVVAQVPTPLTGADPSLLTFTG